MSRTAATKSSELTLRSIGETFLKEYGKTPMQLRVLDLFSVCALATALFQFIYAFLVGSFPFNAFLAGFFCCIGCFVLTLSLRMQLSGDDGSGKIEDGKTPRRAFVDYVFAMTVLFIAVWCYIG
ncbi:hypothetical protein Ndes2437B_g02144 [Nannochloris sp. 'desiccata']